MDEKNPPDSPTADPESEDRQGSSDSADSEDATALDGTGPLSGSGTGRRSPGGDESGPHHTLPAEPLPATQADIPMPATRADVPMPATQADVPMPATQADIPMPATQAETPLAPTQAETPLPATQAETPLEATRVDAPFPDAPAPSEPQPAGEGVVLVADLPGYASRAEQDQKNASAVLARMQQIIGEAIYLFEGRIQEDPFEPVVMATLPSAMNGLEAARKIRRDLASHNTGRSDREVVDARVVIHQGELRDKGDHLAGRALESALAILDALAPLQIGVSEAVAQGAQAIPQGDPLAVLGVDRFFDLESLPLPSDDEATIIEGPPSQRLRPAKARPRWLIPVLGGLGAVVLIGVVIAFVLRREPAPAASDPVTPVPSPVAEVRISSIRIALERFFVEGGDAAAANHAALLRATTLRMLEAFPQLQIVDPSGRADVRVGVRTTEGPDGPLLVPFLLSGYRAEEAQALPLTEAGVAAGHVTGFIGRALNLPGQKVVSRNPEALNSFAQAVALTGQSRGRGNEQALEQVNLAIEADPDFLPAVLLAADLYTATGDQEAALVALRRAAELDPENLDLARKHVQWELRAGHPGEALDSVARVLERRPQDREALQVLGHHTVAIGDPALFARVREHLANIPIPERELHEGDALAAAGKVDEAATKYYEEQKAGPGNAALSFKIGRIAVLRRSMEIANLELDKLRRLEAPYYLSMLTAFVAAQQQDAATAEVALRDAQQDALWNHAFHTHAAEVFILLNRSQGVLPSLAAAVHQGEPTLEMILTSPLFQYLRRDPEFQELVREIQARKRVIRQKLENLPLTRGS